MSKFLDSDGLTSVLTKIKSFINNKFGGFIFGSDGNITCPTNEISFYDENDKLVETHVGDLYVSLIEADDINSPKIYSDNIEGLDLSIGSGDSITTIHGYDIDTAYINAKGVTATSYISTHQINFDNTSKLTIGDVDNESPIDYNIILNSNVEILGDTSVDTLSGDTIAAREFQGDLYGNAKTATRADTATRANTATIASSSYFLKAYGSGDYISVGNVGLPVYFSYGVPTQCSKYKLFSDLSVSGTTLSATIFGNTKSVSLPSSGGSSSITESDVKNIVDNKLGNFYFKDSYIDCNDYPMYIYMMKGDDETTDFYIKITNDGILKTQTSYNIIGMTKSPTTNYILGTTYLNDIYVDNLDIYGDISSDCIYINNIYHENTNSILKIGVNSNVGIGFTEKLGNYNDNVLQEGIGSTWYITKSGESFFNTLKCTDIDSDTISLSEINSSNSNDIIKLNKYTVAESFEATSYISSPVSYLNNSYLNNIFINPSNGINIIAYDKTDIIFNNDYVKNYIENNINNGLTIENVHILAITPWSIICQVIVSDSIENEFGLYFNNTEQLQSSKICWYFPNSDDMYYGSIIITLLQDAGSILSINNLKLQY